MPTKQQFKTLMTDSSTYCEITVPRTSTLIIDVRMMRITES